MRKGHAIKQVRKLDLNDNDVLVLNYDAEDSASPDFAEWLQRFAEAVRRTGKAVSIIALKKGTRLSHVTEEEMNNIGWYVKG